MKTHYAQGFIDRCKELGYDAEKVAQATADTWQVGNKGEQAYRQGVAKSNAKAKPIPSAEEVAANRNTAVVNTDLKRLAKQVPGAK